MFAGGGGGGQSFTKFIPNAGKKTDDFPDLGEAVAQKKTKKEREKEERKKAQEARQAEIDAMPHKGKPSEFFFV